MMMVLRRARKIPDQQNTSVENPPEDLQAFRTQAAWVLLGEPGAGKSAAIEMEAAATNGKYLRIDEFINSDPEIDWRDKTLFFDGLDETRASGGSDSTLQQLCRQLKRLGNPPFRVACRAADWYGSTDRDDLKRASPNAQFDVLLLEPLTDEDILTILRENYPHDIPDPRLFVQQAEQRGIDGLLDILIHGEALQGLAPTLLAMVGDDSWWPVVRRAALDAWLKLTTEPHVARALLDEVTAGRMADLEDELAGTLLRYLYPTHLEPKALLGYLHVPKNSRLYGVYSEFWTRGLLRCVPDSHIPILLDGLVDRSEFASHDPYERRLNRMVDALLAHGITVHGDGIADERLCAWLGIGADE